MFRACGGNKHGPSDQPPMNRDLKRSQEHPRTHPGLPPSPPPHERPMRVGDTPPGRCPSPHRGAIKRCKTRLSKLEDQSLQEGVNRVVVLKMVDKKYCFKLRNLISVLIKKTPSGRARPPIKCAKWTPHNNQNQNKSKLHCSHRSSLIPFSFNKAKPSATLGACRNPPEHLLGSVASRSFVTPRDRKEPPKASGNLAASRNDVGGVDGWTEKRRATCVWFGAAFRQRGTARAGRKSSWLKVTKHLQSGCQ